METGVGLIASERQRQIVVENISPAHDIKEHSDEALVKAAVCYALPDDGRKQELAESKGTLLGVLWPWDWRWWKPSKDRVRDLTKAGALIAAEIDRLLAEAE